MSNRYVAINSIYFALFCLLFIHCYNHLTFLGRKAKALEWIEKIKENVIDTSGFFPGVLDFKLIDQSEDCELVTRYERDEFYAMARHDGRSLCSP